MKPLRATAWVGLGSIASLVLSILAMKAYAVLVGPNGVGLLSLMQSLVNLGVMVAGLGVTTTAISALSAAASSGDTIRFESIRRAVLLISFATGVVGAGMLVLFRVPIAEIALGTPHLSVNVVVLAAALLCNLMGFATVSVLTGRRAIRSLTLVTVATALGAAAVGVGLVFTFGAAGLAPAVLAGAFVYLGTALWFERQTPERLAVRTNTGEVARAGGRLVRLGLPIAASQMAGTGAGLIAPVFLLHLLGPTEVGYYRAATAITVGYLTVFVATLTQDYLPRISSAGSAAELASMVERQMRLILGLALPLIFGLLAAGSLTLHLLYAEEFTPSFAIVQWQLVGDVVRLPGWILAFVLLARGRSAAYLAAELTAGVGLLVAISVGVEAFGLAGAGVGYAASQVLYYLVVWLLVRAHVSTTPGRLQAVAAACAALAAGIVLVAPAEPYRSALFAIVACILAALAWPRIYGLYRAGEL